LQLSHYKMMLKRGSDVVVMAISKCPVLKGLISQCLTESSVEGHSRNRQGADSLSDHACEPTVRFCEGRRLRQLRDGGVDIGLHELALFLACVPPRLRVRQCAGAPLMHDAQAQTRVNVNVGIGDPGVVYTPRPPVMVLPPPRMYWPPACRLQPILQTRLGPPPPFTGRVGCPAGT
jgi:hypothetical protein